MTNIYFYVPVFIILIIIVASHTAPATILLNNSNAVPVVFLRSLSVVRFAKQ